MPISVSDIMKGIGKDAFHSVACDIKPDFGIDTSVLGNVTRDTQKISDLLGSTALRDALRSVENIADIAVDVKNNFHANNFNDERVKRRPAIQQWLVYTP